MKKAQLADKLFGLINKSQGKLVMMRRAQLEAQTRTAAPQAVMPADKRDVAAQIYLSGQGLEIGALHRPLAMPPGAKVRYIDRMTNAELEQHYPELKGQPLVPVDIVDDDEKLGKIPAGSQDFVVANHFLEHCQNPIQTLKNISRVLKKDGLLYLVIPDKRFTFDSDRPVTPFEHILADYRDGPERSKQAHFEEWTRLVAKKADAEEAKKHTAMLIKEDYSIHFHVWTLDDMAEFFLATKKQMGIKLEIELILRNGEEVIFILRRTDLR